MKTGKCRFCNEPLTETFADLGMSPLSNAYVKREKAKDAETFYPLHAYVCKNCYLVQLEEFETPENIFSDYAYFSSFSQSWLEHSKNYVNVMVKRFGFDHSSLIAEIASNDGYLLQYFVEKKIPVLGIEPAANVAKTAIEKGIPTEIRFFGNESAKQIAIQKGKADLIAGNNVLAHVPDINDFVSGLKIFLKETGVITIEFPHLLELIKHSQFDTIYHEHFSYLSLLSVEKIFAAHKLVLFDVEKIPTHGGSLRIYAQHKNGPQEQTQRLLDLRKEELEAGLNKIETYTSFNSKIIKIKADLLSFMIEQIRKNKTVVAYGAPAKGNTLLNYCGIGKEFIPFTVDLSPYKQNTLLPGTHIPVYAPQKIDETKPDFVLILPWNLRNEITSQMAHISKWGGKFVVPIPQLEVLD